MKLSRYIAFKNGGTPLRTNNGQCSDTVSAAKQHASRLTGNGAYVVEYALVPTGTVWVKNSLGKWEENNMVEGVLCPIKKN